MGIYNAHLLQQLYELKLAVWLESSLQIKQAGGMQRGKTDKVDAQRIAQYAYRFRDQMRLWQPPREIIQKLAFLSATRQRLNQAGAPVRYNLLAVPVAEQETFIGKSLQKTLKGNVQKSLTALKDEQKAVEQQIKEPHGRPRHSSRRSAERTVRSDGLCAGHRPCDRDRTACCHQRNADYQ